MSNRTVCAMLTVLAEASVALVSVRRACGYGWHTSGTTGVPLLRPLIRVQQLNCSTRIERDATARYRADFRRGVTLAELVGADGIEPPTAGV